MISALYRYEKKDRRKVAAVWAHRSNAVQAAKRIARGVDAETIRRREIDDARGEIVRHGVTYTARREIPWCVRRAVAGRVNQVEIVAAGKIVRTCSARRADRLLAR